LSDTTKKSPPYGPERQLQVYMAGLQGQRLALPVSPEDLEQRANEHMTPEARGYMGGMSDTMQANREAFRQWRIVPRMLRGVAQRDLSAQILDMELPAPILLAPVGVQSILHPDAEVAVARAAAKVGLPCILSTASSKSIEEVAAAMGQTLRWYQLYWSKDNDLNASFVRRAEQAGYKAIVITLDTPILAWREQDIANAYLPFLRGEGLANYFSDPVFRQSLPQPPEENPFPAIIRFSDIFGNPALTWQDLSSLRQHTSLPIFLKGILHPDDARKALECGMNGIIVSNHGGRQVNGARAALNALPEVVAAVEGRIPVLFDSGIRRGSDIIKAIALGAQAVLVGRLYSWGLTLAGEQGVEEVLRNLLADLDLTLALSGYRSLKELDRGSLVRE
jgi:isopentenyl diphosphate isomerase/L-lactate dehydrogenase-like FMN-dependent dehydrogenase